MHLNVSFLPQEHTGLEIETWAGCSDLWSAKITAFTGRSVGAIIRTIENLCLLCPLWLLGCLSLLSHCIGVNKEHWRAPALLWQLREHHFLLIILDSASHCSGAQSGKPTANATKNKQHWSLPGKRHAGRKAGSVFSWPGNFNQTCLLGVCVGGDCSHTTEMLS